MLARRSMLALRSKASRSANSWTSVFRRCRASFLPDSATDRKNCATMKTMSTKITTNSKVARPSTNPGQMLTARLVP